MQKLLTTFLFTGCTYISMAQTPEVLDTAVVSAERFNTSLQSANRNVVILKGEEIEDAPVESISELLDFAVGIDARQRGTFGTQTDLSIRGGTYEQVLVLINGIRLSDPQTGHHTMNLPVQKSDIERIEILMGGGSYIFGGSAFSGAINIITKKAEANKLAVNGSFGSYNSYRAGVIQYLAGEDHQTQISVNTTSSDGFKRNTDFQNTNIFAQSNLNLGDHRLNISGGYNWQGFGAQNFYSSVFPEQYEKTRTLFTNLGLSSSKNEIQIDRQVYWRRNWDEFQLYREGPGFYEYEKGLFIKGQDTAASFYTKHNYHRSDAAGGKIEVRFKSIAGKTSIGSEYRYEAVVSNNLGDSLEAPINIPGSRGIYTLGNSRHNVSLAIEQAKSIGKWDLSLAILGNYNTAYRPGVYPAATAGYNFNPRNKLYASVNRSFRLPSYTDLYYNLGGALGSKNLKPENSLNYEIGYKYLSGKWFGNISLFRREGTNIIDWIKRCDTCDLIASNTSEVNFNGGEFTLRHEVREWSIDHIEIGYSHLFTDRDEFDHESVYVFDYLRNKIVLRIQHNPVKQFRLSYSVSYQDRNGQYMDAAKKQLQDYPEVLLINARLAYQYKMGDIYISGQNLLDNSYYDRGNVELPGLWVWAGASFSL